MSRVFRGYRLGQKSWQGKPITARCVVTVDPGDAPTYPLDPRHDIRIHSPDGFEWGYGGSGPAQLALALLAAVLPVYTARHFYQKFKARVIARLSKDGWILSEQQIREDVEMLAGQEFGSRDAFLRWQRHACDDEVSDTHYNPTERDLEVDPEGEP